jgi:hypothetical protein
MKTGSTLAAVALKIDQLRRSARDFLACPPQLRMVAQSGERTLSLVLDDGSGALSFAIADAVHDQVADYAGIPMAYYRRMKDQAPELLAANANAWLARGEGRRLVRTARGADDRPQARAFLSDRFRPLDHDRLLEAVMPVLGMPGIRIASCELTAKRLYLKAVSERVTGEVRVGETVMAGVIISNSEVGFGAVSIQPLIYTVRCTNGLVIEDASLRQHHVGRRHGDPGDGDIRHLLSDEARDAEDHAFFLTVRDIAGAALSQSPFRQHLARLQSAAQLAIANPALDRVVEVTARRFGLNDQEGAGVLAQLIRGGDLSQWGLCSAITRHSQDLDDYDRATELERVGGRLVDLPLADWDRLSSAN